MGHIYPVWLRFRGGKGVATLMGIVVALHWPSGLVYAAVWLGLLAALRISSLAGITAATTDPADGRTIPAGNEGGSDVLDIDEANVGASILADLRAVAHLPDSVYDCIVLTQTLHVIPEMTEAIAE